MATWEGQFDLLLNQEAWFDVDYADDGVFGEDWVKTYTLVSPVVPVLGYWMTLKRRRRI